MSDFDVVIVGAGIAGLSAAVAAAEHGAERIMVAEAAAIAGGSTRLSSGILLGGDNRIQRDAGFPDSADHFYLDYMNVNQWALRGDVIRTFTSRAGETIDWLESLGVEFYPDAIYGGTEPVPRCVAATGKGQGVVDALATKARALGVQFAFGQRVDRLLWDGERVNGVAVGDDELSADSVILATGGFGASEEKLRRLFPSAVAEAGEWLWYIGSKESRGDGIDLGEQVGARLAGLDHGLRLLHPGFGRQVESYLPGWLILVGPDGRRLVDESAPYGMIDRLVHLAGGVAYVIFDQRAADPATARSTEAYANPVPGRAAHRTVNWNPSMIEDMVAEGRIVTGDRVGVVAERLGLPVEHLEATVAAYNDGVAAGVDAMGKKPCFLRALDLAPFFGAQVRLATVCATWAGLEIDGAARVLDNLGRAIPGLYAAGETTGSVMGTVDSADGNHLGHSATFGRVAGEMAANAIS